MNISLRKALELDLDFLLDLRMKTMHEYLQASGVPVTKAAHLERVHHKFDKVKIIEVDGTPVGMIKIARVDSFNYWELVQIQVLPHYQNMKIAHRVVTVLMEKAKREHMDVRLSVLKVNPAKKLYQRLGFTEVGATEHEFEMPYQPR